MIKVDIVNEVSKTADITKVKAEVGVDAVFDEMSLSMQRGERIELRGFGVFQVKPRKRGIGRNPRTGKEVRIPPGRTIRFKPGKPSEYRVNGPYGRFFVRQPRHPLSSGRVAPSRYVRPFRAAPQAALVASHSVPDDRDDSARRRRPLCELSWRLRQPRDGFIGPCHHIERLPARASILAILGARVRPLRLQYYGSMRRCPTFCRRHSC